MEADARAGGHLGGDGPELDGDLGAVAVGGAVEAEGALDEVDRAAAERGAADEAAAEAAAETAAVGAPPSPGGRARALAVSVS